LRPEPPTSMERVMGAASLPEVGLASFEDLGAEGFAGLGVSRRNCTRGGGELCGGNWGWSGVSRVGGVGRAARVFASSLRFAQWRVRWGVLWKGNAGFARIIRGRHIPYTEGWLL
jgi:hypothetical protein